MWQHRNDLADGFTKRYGVHRLVWYEQCGITEAAIAREKAIKEWKRAWKIRLIESVSLSGTICKMSPYEAGAVESFQLTPESRLSFEAGRRLSPV